MWIKNKETGCEFDIEDEELISRLLKQPETYEEIVKETKKSK